MYQPVKTVTIAAGLIVVLGVMMLVSVGIGQTPLHPGTVAGILSGALFGTIHPGDATNATIILDIRLPRIILAALVGACLAVCGAALQSLFKNPMADPFILGISSGAALGATIIMAYGITLGLGIYDLPLLAFLGALVTIYLVYRVAKIGQKIPVNTLLLSGIAVSAFFSAMTSLIMFSSHASFELIMFWTMGGFSGRGWNYIWMILPFAFAGILVVIYYARSLNVLMFGEESARYLGIDTEKLKKILLVVSAIMTGAAVAVSGVIGFVGLIIPHITRLIVGPDHRILLPVTSLAGALFLVIADIVARTAIAPAELPIGVITAMCGAPFFLYLLRKKRGEL
ncbi:MAG: iron chelate uptake ABC transporter family permease subunit [Methanospirillaceae archaeon]|nr:iron chelate uptake ABC transporter family permease subunit [Methanospirillaceae archaeon]